MSLYRAFRNVAFCFDAESVHEKTIQFVSRHPFLSSALFQPKKPDPRLQLVSGNLTWSFPVGLAAGMDKNAQALEFFMRLPLGAVEVGSVTPRPQTGNPRPRLFRLKKEHSLRNHLGLNSTGVQAVLDNILRTEYRRKILGVNIGKNKSTPETQVPRDYRLLYRSFAPVCDYLTINVSSPNTPGMRDFQKKHRLRAILSALADIRTNRPLFVKIAPQLSNSEISDIVELAKMFHLQGIIATNTLPIPGRGAGGCSGRLLRECATETRQRVLEQLAETPHITVIASGGIEDISDLIRFWKQGGKIAQVYTALIFQGPDMLARIHRDILKLIDESGASSLQELLDNIDQW